MKYYISMFMLCTLTCLAITGSTIMFASMYDPEADKLVRIFIDCIVTIIKLGQPIP